MAETGTAMSISPERADVIPVTGLTAAVISRSRQAGADFSGAPRTAGETGNILPRLCTFAGQEACKAACHAPADYPNTSKYCARMNGLEFLEELGVDKEDMYLGVVTGSANVVFLDDSAGDAKPNPEGYKSFPQTDGVFGYGDTVKACRLADCGMLVVSGKDKDGRPFDGFIHATRNNMNGDDQFEDAEGRPMGGVEKMLAEVVAHYEPSEIDLKLVAVIAPEYYVFDFEPTAKELEADPTLTAAGKRERMFKGWFEQGWIRPKWGQDGKWDGKSYEVNMYAAVRHQVERAGLLDRYTDNDVTVNGDVFNGHASNSAGKHGVIPEARDFYVVVPAAYQKQGR